MSFFGLGGGSKAVKEDPEGARPRLNVCSKCHGKGQLSYYTTNQKKTYEPCRECSKQPEDGMYSLGVALKCTCMFDSAPYVWLSAANAKYMPPDLPEVKAVRSLQKTLGTTGSALFLNCLECNAKYLAIDSEKQRRIISGNSERNDDDKEFNKEIAEALVGRGIQKVLVPGPLRVR